MAALGYQDLYDLLTSIRDERRLHANTAIRIGGALLELLAYLDNAPYLRKDRADATEFLISFLKGVVVGEPEKIRLNPDGSISCERIHVSGSAVFEELVINKQSATSGDTVFTDRGTVDALVYMNDNRFRLTMRKEYDADVTTFKVNDCLKCMINRLDTEGSFFTSWSRVVDVDYDDNTVDVILYPDEEVPGGQNYAPVVGAVVARWGNAVDEDRQNSFYLSATDGRFCFLQKVTKPVINDEGSNVTAFIGLPNDVPAIKRLVEEGTLSEKDPILYAKTAVVENLITVKHDGSPDYIQREWDAWDAEKTYIRGYDTEEERYVQDNVWHGGSLWRCIVAEARTGVEPSLTNTDWACLRSGGLTLDIESTEGDWFNGEKNFQTVLVAMVMHGDLLVSDEDIESVTWTRESGDDGADEAWNINQAKKGQTMNLTVTYDLDNPEQSDIPVGLPYGSKCGFRCTVTGGFAVEGITNIYNIS